MRPLRWLLLALLLAAPGLVTPAGASEMVPGFVWRAKEFAIVKGGGLFHIFYMRRDATLPLDGSYVDLGHATSPDLVHWTQQAPVLPIRPNNWDNREIWAPHVIERAGVYYMYYTGVTNTPPAHDLHQRIGLAISTDLYNWTRFDEPVWECSDVPWTYCDPTTPSGGEFRDPFVMPDPLSVGSYLLYYVARTAADHDQYLMGAARSTGDLTQWTSIGSFPNLDRTKTGSAIIESPTLLQHARRWYLFYTSWTAHPIQFQVSADPLGGPATWGPATRLDVETGWATDSWFGPETFSDGGKDYLAAVESNASYIVIWQILWGANGHFTLGNAVVLGADPPPARSTAWDLTCLSSTPIWDRLEFSITAPVAASARVEVRDVSGRSRRLLLNGTVETAGTRLAWDGTDDRGEPVGSGVYFVTLDAPGVRLTRRVVRLR